MCGSDATCCKLHYQPKNQKSHVKSRENMSIRLENVDKPESIVDLGKYGASKATEEETTFLFSLL